MGRIARNLINVPVVLLLVALLSGCDTVILRDIVAYSVLDPKISVEQGGAPVSSYDFGPVLYRESGVDDLSSSTTTGRGT